MIRLTRSLKKLNNWLVVLAILRDGPSALFRMREICLILRSEHSERLERCPSIRRRWSFPTFAALVTLGVSGCATTPDPTYYLFPIPAVEETVAYDAGTVAVREISLPLYARQELFASVAEDGSVILPDDHRWADEPARAATGALVATLKQLLGAQIVAEPWPTSVSPAYRVDVTVDRFIGDIRGGDLEFTGQYRLFGLGDSTTDVQDSFSYRIDIAEPGYKALAQAHSDAIVKLAREIAGRLSDRPTG